MAVLVQSVYSSLSITWHDDVLSSAVISFQIIHVFRFGQKLKNTIIGEKKELFEALKRKSFSRAVCWLLIKNVISRHNDDEQIK